MKEQKAFKSGILLYSGVEILDVAGPAEVFAATDNFKTICVSISTDPLKSKGGFTLVPDYNLEECPHLDVLVIPGGAIEKIQNNPEVLRWLKAMSIKANILMSVCTGAFLLAAAGLLDGKTFTTHHQHIDKLQKLVPYGKAIRNLRYTDSGNIVSTAGISAGIDGALHVVRRLQGTGAAQHAATNIEYPYWQQASATDRPPIYHWAENTNLRGNK